MLTGVNWTPSDPDFAKRVADSFGKQTIMATLGASLGEVTPGRVAIELPFREDLCQQHGYLHAGVVSTIADSACGYAALTLCPSDEEVVAVEFKVNFLSPALGERAVAQAEVLRKGRQLAVCRAEVFCYQGDQEKCVAAMQGTIMSVRP